MTVMTPMPVTMNVIRFQPRLALRRPRLLAEAARRGTAQFNRARDLPRLLKCEETPAAGAALPRLLIEEQRQNDARLERKADYDLQRHVLLLIAIRAEMILSAPVPVTCPGTMSQARP